MGNKILICLNPFISHFLPMIPFIKRLREIGNDVLLMGDMDIKEAAESEKFEFVPITSFSNSKFEEMRKKEQYSEMEELYRALYYEVLNQIDKFEPKYILMGISRYHLYLRAALESRAEVILFSLCCGIPFFNGSSPPISSDYIPRRNLFGRLNNIIIWRARLKRKGLSASVIKERKTYPWKEIREICKKRGIGQRFGIDGYFPDYKILTFGTSLLEFDENIYKWRNLNFVGVDIRDDLQKQESEYKAADEKLIYCSFGTMNHRYMNINEFVLRLIEVVRDEPKIKLVVSTGEAINLDCADLPQNVKTYKFAPQISILKQADMVITHGGYGTVKECINMGVPMLVLPCIYDQRGNAARVHNSQIGIRDFMLQVPKKSRKEEQNSLINKEHIKSLVEEILYNPVYKENIDRLRTNIRKLNELDEVCESVFE